MGDTQLVDALNKLDTESLLAAGALNFRNTKLARAAGRDRLANVHTVIGAYIDQALCARVTQP
jgi:hypothetical protein